MIRRIHISLRPSEALLALVALHGPVVDVTALHTRPTGASAAAHTFGARLGQEVSRSFEAHARALDVLGQCLDWLERRGLASVERPRARGSQRAFTWQCPAEVRVNVHDLSREITAEEGAPDSRARASAWALRAVLRHLAGGALHACEVRAGNERLPPIEALAACDAAFVAVGYGPNSPPPARLAHLSSRSKRRDEAVVPPAPKPTEEPVAKVKAKAKAAPAPSEKKPRPKKAEGGFGGLPDDAMPEDRRTGDVFSARGLTLDAEFFLVEAVIAEWPCDAKVLERGRRMVASKLHPDRAGEASTTAFHRAIKGHAELLKKLSTTTSATVSAVVEKPVAVEKPTVTEPVVAAKPAVAEKPSKRTRVKAVVPTSESPSVAPPTVTMPPAPVASGTTYEWPPRPAQAPRPVKVPPPVEAPRPASATTTAVRGKARDTKSAAAARAPTSDEKPVPTRSRRTA